MPNRFIPLVIPLTEARQDAKPGDPPKPTLYGRLTLAWLEFFRALNQDLTTVEAVQLHRWALADQPTLAAADAGYLAFVTDYGHLVRWAGTVWEFAPGDVGNRFMRFFVGAPQESTFWQLADGTATTFLTVGAASLTTTAFTTPNIPAGTFVKALAAYTGLIDAAIAPVLSGSTATEAAHTHAAGAVSGSTATEAAHTHAGGTITGATALESAAVVGTSGAEAAHTHAAGAVSGNTAGPSATVSVQAGTADTIVATQFHFHGVGTLAVGTSGAGSSHTHGAGTYEINAHDHDVGTLAVGTSGAGSAHSHTAGTLAVGTSGAGSAHSHTVGTLVGDTAARPPSLGLLAYFRR